LAILDDGVHRVRITEVSEDVSALAGPPIDVRTSTVMTVPPEGGRVVRVAVTSGARVRRGQTLIVLEAMKMQNEIPSPGEGVVRDVRVSAGETVTADAIVASIELRGPLES
jgi:pyruvate carboxylase subunit B